MKTARVLLVIGALGLALVQAGAQQVPPPALPAGDAANTSDGLQVGDRVEVGQPLHAPDPAIPKEFRKKNVAVVLHGTITTDGTFKDLAVVSGEPALAAPALDAAQRSRYSPCTLNGAPIETPIYFAVGFTQGKVKAWVEPDLPFPTKPAEAKAGGDEVFRVAHGGTTAPKAIYAPDPEYSQTARVAKYQGTLLLGVIVGPDGNPRDVWIARKLGLGLDQKAIETVRQWKFEPATKDGEPVAVLINVEVTFRLY